MDEQRRYWRNMAWVWVVLIAVMVGLAATVIWAFLFLLAGDDS